jgi:signal transduction histidine kinase
MNLLSSLRRRIALASALLAVLPIVVAIYVVNVRVRDQSEQALQREIVRTGALVDQLRSTGTETYTELARLIADNPYLRAAAATGDPATVQNTARDIQQKSHASLVSQFLIVTNKAGDVFARAGASAETAAIVPSEPAVQEALAGRDAVSVLAHPNGVIQIVTVPISDVSSPLATLNPEILGTVSVGFLLDDALAAQLKDNSGSDIAFTIDGRILASTLPPADRESLAQLSRRADPSGEIHIGSEDYVVMSRPLASSGIVLPSGSRPTMLILRSRADQRQLLQSIHAALYVTALIAVVVATLLSFAIARTITRPLAAITDVMRQVAATGDLTRKIALSAERRWGDEDARLLASTFNTLTDSIARFQREISQKERLSSLGRLSTVIAHEVRNPLLIIKASLHALRQPDVPVSSIREAVADIDGEVVRLNRVVNEVLDFARPIAFELAPTDLNALCRKSAAASETGTPGPPVGLELDPALPPVAVDTERLRIALVNILVNARHAVAAHERAQPVAAAGGSTGTQAAIVHSGSWSVTLKTIARDDRATIIISDRGGGITAADLPRIFDPYFTTKRGGTGLGLPIAKNIVEGLGGTIAATSAPGHGTEIRIDLPSAGQPDFPRPSSRAND